jgi:hypothetical protein
MSLLNKCLNFLLASTFSDIGVLAYLRPNSLTLDKVVDTFSVSTAVYAGRSMVRDFSPELGLVVSSIGGGIKYATKSTQSNSWHYHYDGVFNNTSYEVVNYLVGKGLISDSLLTNFGAPIFIESMETALSDGYDASLAHPGDTYYILNSAGKGFIDALPVGTSVGIAGLVTQTASTIVVAGLEAAGLAGAASVVLPAATVALGAYAAYRFMDKLPMIQDKYNKPYILDKKYADVIVMPDFIALNKDMHLRDIPEGYKVLYESNSNEFHATVFYNNENNKVVISISSDNTSPFGIIKFIKEIEEDLREEQGDNFNNIKFITTGKGKGAVLSDVTAYQLSNDGIKNIQAINFDNPGSYSVISGLRGLEAIKIADEDGTLREVYHDFFEKIKGITPEIDIQQYQYHVDLYDVSTLYNLTYEQIGEVHTPPSNYESIETPFPLYST